MSSEAARRYAEKLGVALPASLPAASQSVTTVTSGKNRVVTGLAVPKPAENCPLYVCVTTVTTVTTDLIETSPDAEFASDSPHIAAEPLLPPPGSPERQRIDQQHAALRRALKSAFDNHRRARDASPSKGGQHGQ